jgi:hypothetical protein
MAQPKFTECKRFNRTTCQYSNDGDIMEKFVNQVNNSDEYDKQLAKQVDELRCGYCSVFEHKK